ncbi:MULTISPECIES: molybdopterin oxidoreductase family protein [unclassified Lentimonas]|uniref:molybdopterin oxidoreductase family protein n=1 Tax=unclassified Lentimonas TaxID=2630993 RepID=UPI00132953B5|nr:MULTISPECIES: nitrate reductase [unclassified Lentimonas]CAA6678021.1 Assimilatory nitrate reductase large subunit [Lentimonas sp. CC4]CAA6686995.1 Assimilatory nitrate reductase large subunit [Lentimonas sp. CC6]CAA7075838.1 Assimilatory nitrate reductase large subunit [Lentimonas sp. CC4]CAA7172036.1 Assimilatory nitrate reductase large subunit [Lentimonas sp. CC21]CAA7182901.1 Assimilatory nitrate reductase large subunit [Lentimonas sp. CC8]
MSPVNLIKDQMRVRCHDGVLTERLVQAPAAYGLGRVPEVVKPDATVDSVCGYCGTGCSLKVHLRDGAAVNLSGNTSYPVNMGMACPKGWEALTPLSAKDRATTPMLRGADGKLAAASWEEAMGAFVGKFKGIQAEHGDASVAFLSTGQIVTEEMAFLGSLAKFGMGVVHGDGNTRQCMATAVVAYKQSFGFDSPPYTYQDFEESDVLIFVGANPCIAHPIMWQRVMRNQRNPEIIVVDPRKTETAMAATRHLPLAPKSDLALFYGLANRVIELGMIDQAFLDAHTNDFDAFKVFLADYSLEHAAEMSGLPYDELDSLARLIGSGKRVSFWWTMGVNQSYEGVRLAQSMINLALMTGNIGKPGTGANSITGQCNAMGSRLFSNTTSLLGGRAFEKDEDRQTVSDLTGIPVERIPSEPSYAYDQIIDAIERGEIKGLWMVATNSAHSWINQKRFRKIREKLDFLVVQDMYHTTESAEIADLVLPAAGWGEKDGVFINSERRIGRIRKVRKAPGEALSDFNIFRLISHYWGCGELFAEWSSPEAVFQILKRLSEGKPCDITGIEDYDHLDREGGIQWPAPAASDAASPSGSESEGAPAASAGEIVRQRRLFEDGKFYHADGRAKFLFEAPRSMPEPPNADYPFILLTGRGTSSQWHTQTRTSKSDVLRKLYPQDAYVEINPIDADRLGIAPDDLITVSSRRGEVQVKAVLLASVQQGQLFMPMHYTTTNQLTADAFDPYSRQPSSKACAVNVTK